MAALNFREEFFVVFSQFIYQMNCPEFVYMLLDKDKDVCLWSKNVKCHTQVKGKEKISHFKMLAVKGHKRFM